MAYKINGETLPLSRSFKLGDIMYPANWLQKSTEAERTALGITWEDDPVRADDRYYWDGDINNPKMLDDRLEVDENGQPFYELTLDNSDPLNPVMVPKQPLVQVKTLGLKSTMTAQVKHTAGTILASTDWYVTRKSEKAVDIPVDVETKRDAVRTECDRLEVAIAAVTTVEELITVMNSQDWGE
jgi:hypothetical protein